MHAMQVINNCRRGRGGQPSRATRRDLEFDLLCLGQGGHDSGQQAAMRVHPAAGARDLGPDETVGDDTQRRRAGDTALPSHHPSAWRCA